MDAVVRFLYNQFFVTLPAPSGSYAGQTVIITGANTGLGKEAARHFARLGASTIILAVRSLSKGEAAKSDIEATTGCGPDIVQVWSLDMCSYDSVRDFASRIERELPRVDIMIENAGITTLTFKRAEEGESTITTNVVSTFLLASLVLPKLRETAQKFNIRPTLTIVASEMHAWAKFEERNVAEGKIFEALSDESTWEKRKGDRYSVSKLLEILAVQSIGKRYNHDSYPVTINCVNPGFCHSELNRDNDSWAVRLIKRILARTTEEGSRILVHAGSQGADTHGKYLSNCTIIPSEGLSYGKGSEELRDRVWVELVQKLDSIQPGTAERLDPGKKA